MVGWKTCVGVAVIAATLGIPVVAGDQVLDAALEKVDSVTGHTVFAENAAFDPNIAALAGLVERKVVWFNGIMIFNTFQAGFVLVTENDSCDPTLGEDFRFVDQNLSYMDPNGQAHVVTHYTFRCDEHEPFASAFNDTALENGLGFRLRADVNDSNPDQSSFNVSNLHFREDVWVTHTHDNIEQFFPPAEIAFYNFALAVDIRYFDEGAVLAAAGEDAEEGVPRDCPPGWPQSVRCFPRFLQTAKREHDGEGGESPEEVKDGDSFHGPCADDPSRTCHTPDASGSAYNKPHDHNERDIDIFFTTGDPGQESSACVADARGDVCRQQLFCPTDPPGPERCFPAP